jgi:Squalene/phytoene synthase
MLRTRTTAEPQTLSAAYERCRQLHARHGRTYYLATLLLPRWKRRHVHALYGFARYAVEIVDDQASTLDRPGQAAALQALRDRFFAGLRGAPCQDPVLPAVLHTARAFDLDPADFERFLDSMAMNLHTTSYPTYQELCGYMEGSAAAIGTMMAPILESSDPPAARTHARQLGLAFQLTNFIRDVAEDLERGRVYLPTEDLERFGSAGPTWPPPRPPPGRASAAGLRGHPGPGPLCGRRARHRTPGRILPALCPGRLRAVRRHPGPGRTGRLPDPGSPGRRPPPPPPGRGRPPLGRGLRAATDPQELGRCPHATPALP